MLRCVARPLLRHDSKPPPMSPEWMPPDWAGRLMFAWSIADLLLLPWLWHIAAALDSKPRQEPHEPGNSTRESNIHGEATMIDAPRVEPGTDDNDRYSERQHRIAEQSYWERQIRIAKWMNRLTGAAAIVGLLGLYVLWGTLSATSAQVETARLAQRPWVLLRDITIDGDFEHTGNGMFVAEMRNEGASPAFDLDVGFWCFPETRVADDDDDKFAKRQAPTLDLIAEAAGHWPYLGKDAERGRQTSFAVDPTKSNELNVYCIGVAKYRGSDGQSYATGFARQYTPHSKRAANERLKELSDRAQETLANTANAITKNVVFVIAGEPPADADTDFTTVGGPLLNYAR